MGHPWPGPAAVLPLVARRAIPLSGFCVEGIYNFASGSWPGGPHAIWNDMSFGLLQKINMLPAIPQIEDKSPMGIVFVYAAPNLSGADRSAPVFKR